jgi:ribosomal protein S18 acetylase RimI-like enzyme
MEKSIINVAPPSLVGFSWRPITLDDLAALVELAEECRLVDGVADGGLALMNEPDNLRDRYFPDAPGAAIGAFSADEHLAACNTVHLVRESGTERAIIVGQVRSEWRNRGSGAYLMRWSQVQAQALFTADTADKQLLQVSTESLTNSASRLYQAHGFEPAMEELVMRRDLHLPLPDLPLPPSVTVTSWEPNLADQFFQAYHASFRDRPGFPGWSAAEWIGRRIDDENARHKWSLLARSADVPVGFLTAGTEHPGGFVVQVGVIPEQRRRGLGSALMVETMRRMQAAGEIATQLTVNVNNPGAIQTYAHLDFETVGRRARYELISD